MTKRFFAAAVLFVTVAAAPDRESAISTSLCCVTVDPHRFEDKRIRLSGFAAPGAHYNMSVGDSGCRGQVILAIPESMNEKTEIKALRKLVWKGFPATFGQPRASATFTGTLRIAKNGAPLRYLVLEKLENLSALKSRVGATARD